jgi:hypothetical protein
LSPLLSLLFIDAPEDATLTCSEALTFAAAAVNLSYSNGAADDCLIEGEVLGVIAADYDECGGSITQTWSFTDACGRIIEHVQTITVEPAPEPAFIDAPEDATLTCSEALTFAAAAVNLSYSNGAADDCLIEGEVLGVIAADYDECGGTITQTWSFTDACGRIIEHVQTITVEPAPEPAFIDAPEDATLTCSEALTFAAAAVNLSYSNGAADDCLIEGEVLGVIAADYDECGGTITQTWSFTDACGRIIEHVQTITVESCEITPTFDAVGPYCELTAIPALPTTSNNGITGSWSPAIDNTVTTTYTFTPDAGQCATTTTLTISITTRLLRPSPPLDRSAKVLY